MKTTTKRATKQDATPGFATEMTNSKLVIDQPDLRVYQPEQVKDHRGKLIWIQQCEALEEGRWEPFISILSDVTTPSRDTAR
jgi:hypothetical protein